MKLSHWKQWFFYVIDFIENNLVKAMENKFQVIDF